MTTIPSRSPQTVSPEAHRFAKALAVAALALIAAGGLVEALDEPARLPWMILAYRWIAGAVALLTAILAVWLTREDSRVWCRWLAWAAVVTVPFPALLGFVDRLAVSLPGALVLAVLVQVYLGLVLTLALATSPQWGARAEEGPVARTGRLHWWAAATTVILVLQNLLGVAVRHTGAGLAIADFPLVSGGLVPPDFTLPIGLHYAHRVGALVAAVPVVVLVVRVVRRSSEGGLLIPALALGGLLGFQVALGALVIVTRRAVGPNTLHTVVGPVLFAASLALTLHAWHAWHLAGSVHGSRELRGTRRGSMSHPAAREAVAP